MADFHCFLRIFSYFCIIKTSLTKRSIYKYWFWMMTRLYFKNGEASQTFIKPNSNCLICWKLHILAGLTELL